jgi:hypothetical protein
MPYGPIYYLNAYFIYPGHTPPELQTSSSLFIYGGGSGSGLVEAAVVELLVESGADLRGCKAMVRRHKIDVSSSDSSGAGGRQWHVADRAGNDAIVEAATGVEARNDSMRGSGSGSTPGADDYVVAGVGSGGSGLSTGGTGRSAGGGGGGSGGTTQRSSGRTTRRGSSRTTWSGSGRIMQGSLGPWWARLRLVFFAVIHHERLVVVASGSGGSGGRRW